MDASRHRVRHGTTMFSAVVLAVAATVVPAGANHIFTTYPGRGYMLMARFSNQASPAVSSDGCNAQESDAYTRVKSSTQGTAELNARWPSGISLFQQRCDGLVDVSTWIRIDYSDWSTTHPGSTAGGENHNTAAPSTWCSALGAPSPCGTHPATVHINYGKWATKSDLDRARTIMHETGHSLGLDHHCSSDSIMNNGDPACNSGRWTSVMVYKATDRTGINSIYPGWIYP